MVLGKRGEGGGSVLHTLQGCLSHGQLPGGGVVSQLFDKVLWFLVGGVRVQNFLDFSFFVTLDFNRRG